MQRELAITGTIGSGKSTVASMFRSLGYDVIFLDEEAKRVIKDREVEIKRLFNNVSSHQYDPEVFKEVMRTNSTVRNQICNFLHPIIRDRLYYHPAQIVEAPLLHQYDDWFVDYKRVIYVTCGFVERAKRIWERTQNDEVTMQMLQINMPIKDCLDKNLSRPECTVLDNTTLSLPELRQFAQDYVNANFTQPPTYEPSHSNSE